MAMTTGRGMARTQGFPNLRIAMIGHETALLEGFHEAEEIEKLAQQAALQVEEILLGKS